MYVGICIFTFALVYVHTCDMIKILISCIQYEDARGVELIAYYIRHISLRPRGPPSLKLPNLSRGGYILLSSLVLLLLLV